MCITSNNLPIENITHVSTKIGVRLRYFLPFWETITSDSVILSAIEGAKIPFVTPVDQKSESAVNCSSVEKIKINVISKFIESEVIEEATHCLGEYISFIFPVTKKNKKDIKIILNLKQWYLFVSYEHFKMECLSSALSLVERDCCMASIDLKDAYYSVTFHESSRKYLRFFWNNKLYQFTCLAQGLSCAPRLFTKIMKPIFAHLRSKGFLSTYYLDDSLLLGSSYNLCKENVSNTSTVLQNAGFILNHSKSCYEPSQ